MDPRRLREETRAEHEATEALMPLSSDSFTPEAYVRTLRILFPIIASWENWADRNAPEHLQLLLAPRRRSPFLAADLRHFGQGVPEAQGSVAWERVLASEMSAADSAEREAGFLGALYVMEGSTLGGRFLARHAEEVLGLTAGQGDAYFRGHGDATGSMWREVTEQIAQVPEALAPVLIASARKTFQAFGDALEAGVSAQETVHG